MKRLLRRILFGLVAWRLFGPIVGPRFRPGQEHPWRIPGRSVFVGDREFFVRQVGPEGAPDVVLIHGLAGSSLAEWYEVGPLLAGRYRVTFVDHRSHGLSPRSVDRFEVEDVADDVASVMSAVGVDRADVAGYSMGGTIVQALAYRHPHMVRRMALIATFATHVESWRWARVVGVWAVRAFERLTGVGTPEVRAAYLVLAGAVERKHARWMWEETHRREPESGSAASMALLRFDSSPWIGRLEQPALVVIPTRDFLVPPAWQYQLGALLPDAKVVEIPGARHEIPWAHPADLAKALLEFFD